MKTHFKNEQRSRDAAAKKRANTSGVGKSNYYEDVYNYTSLVTTTHIKPARYSWLPETDSTQHGALEYGPDLHVNERQKIRNSRARSTEE